MYADECALVLILEGGTRGAVGFVANDQVEFTQAMLVLGIPNDFDGVIGTEDDRHVIVVVARADALRQRLGIGGRRKAQFVG